MSSQHSLLERNTTARLNQTTQRIRPSASQLNIFANAVNIPRILEKRGFLQRQQTFEVFKKNIPEYDQGISTQLLIQRRVNEAGRRTISSETKGLMLIKDLWSQHYHKDILKRSHMNSDTEYFKESTRKLETTANMLAKLDTICMEKFIENDEESNEYFKSLAQNSKIDRNELKLQREISLSPVRQNDKKLGFYDQPEGSVNLLTLNNNNMSTCSSNPGIYSSISGINKKRTETATSIYYNNPNNSCKILGTEDKELQLFPWVSNSLRRTSQNSLILEENVDSQNNPGKVIIEQIENQVKLESDRKRRGITSRKSSFHKIIGSLLNQNNSQQQDKGIIPSNENSGKDLKYLQGSSILRHTRTKSSHDPPWVLSRNHVSLEASQQEISTQNFIQRRGSTANVSLIADSRERSPESIYKQNASKSRQNIPGNVESKMILNLSNIPSRAASQRNQSQATLQLREHVGELIKKCERFSSENKQAIAVVDKARVVKNEQDAVNAQKIRELNILSQLNSTTEKKKLMSGNNPRIALAKKRRVHTQYYIDNEG